MIVNCIKFTVTLFFDLGISLHFFLFQVEIEKEKEITLNLQGMHLINNERGYSFSSFKVLNIL